jgi:hypothetical protein
MMQNFLTKVSRLAGQVADEVIGYVRSETPPEVPGNRHAQ